MMYEAPGQLREEEEHFISVKTCKKKITWDAAEIGSILNLEEYTATRSVLNFDIGGPIGKPTNGQLSFEHEFCTRPPTRKIIPSARTESGQSISNKTIKLSLELYSGTKLLWNGKADNYYEKEFFSRFETIPYNILLECNGPFRIILEIEISPREEYFAAVRMPKNASNFTTCQTGERLNQDVSTVLLKTGTGSDFVIKVPNSTKDGFYSRKVHKVVLALASPVFKAMVSSENDTLERKEGVTLIEDLSEKGLDILLEYLYTGIISSNWIHVSFEIFNAAEKYQLPELKDFCKRNLLTCLKETKPLDIDQLKVLSSSPNPKRQLEEMVSKAVDDIISVFKLESLTS